MNRTLFLLHDVHGFVFECGRIEDLPLFESEILPLSFHDIGEYIQNRIYEDRLALSELREQVDTNHFIEGRILHDITLLLQKLVCLLVDFRNHFLVDLRKEEVHPRSKLRLGFADIEIRLDDGLDDSGIHIGIDLHLVDNGGHELVSDEQSPVHSQDPFRFLLDFSELRGLRYPSDLLDSHIFNLPHPFPCDIIGVPYLLERLFLTVKSYPSRYYHPFLFGEIPQYADEILRDFCIFCEHLLILGNE